jgi:fatty-acyl-CoA synthase
MGRAQPHLEIKIVDPATGATVPRGTAGEQYTRGYCAAAQPLARQAA